MDPQPQSPSSLSLRRYALPIVLGVVGSSAGMALAVYSMRHDWNALGWIGMLLLGLSAPAAVQLAKRGGPRMRPAMLRYNNRLMVNMAAYLVVFMGATELSRRGLTPGSLGYVVALVPALLIVNVFVILGRLMREETDELQRLMIQTALLWSGALTLGEATLWGFLETFGKVPHVWLWAVPALFFAQLGITMPLAIRKYR